MPGFGERPPMTYQRQGIPSPRLAHVKAEASVSDIVFDQKMQLTEPMEEDSNILTLKLYHDCHIMSRRMVNYTSHLLYLKKHRETETSKRRLLQKDTAEYNNETYEFDTNTSNFMSIIEQSRTELRTATDFPTNITKYLNPNAGEVDQMIVFPISSHCETTHKGMKMVYAAMASDFHMFTVADNGTTAILPNAKRRKINLHVDGLSSRNFRKLKFNLSRKLTEMGGRRFIQTMLDCLDQFTVQHDYLHETRMHRHDCIWRGMYGCFLRAL